MKDLKKRYTILNRMDSNNMSIRLTLNKWGYTYYLKYYGKPIKDTCHSAINIWGKDAEGFCDEDMTIEKLKADICKLIDDQRTVIVRELKKAGIYEPADV
ncbi:MAG TPA: hypothetical protein VIH90_02695 [Candidatus Saccharimonadales bacterium]